MIQSTREDASVKLLDRAVTGHRLSAGEIRGLYDLPTHDLAAAAHEVRQHRSNPEIATYSIGGNIDYTNICVVACRFCAFYRARHQEGAFTLTLDEIAEQMDELRRIGGRDVLLEAASIPTCHFSGIWICCASSNRAIRKSTSMRSAQRRFSVWSS